MSKPINPSRRAIALGVLAAGVAHWHRPIVDSVMLPVHAATSQRRLRCRFVLRITSEGNPPAPVTPYQIVVELDLTQAQLDADTIQWVIGVPPIDFASYDFTVLARDAGMNTGTFIASDDSLAGPYQGTFSATHVAI